MRDAGLSGAGRVLSLRIRRRVHMDARLHPCDAGARIRPLGHRGKSGRPREIRLRAARQCGRGARSLSGRRAAAARRCPAGALHARRVCGPAGAGAAGGAGLGGAVPPVPRKAGPPACRFAEPGVYGAVHQAVRGGVPLYGLCGCVPHRPLHAAAGALADDGRGARSGLLPRHLHRVRRAAGVPWRQRPPPPRSAHGTRHLHP